MLSGIFTAGFFKCFSGQADPSTADFASLHYVFSCAGADLSAALYTDGSTTASVSCPFDDGPSDHTVSGKIIDKDEGANAYSTSVTSPDPVPTGTPDPRRLPRGLRPRMSVPGLDLGSFSLAGILIAVVFSLVGFAAFRYGIEVAPDEDDLYLNLARTYVNMGERDKARSVIQQWLKRKPQNHMALQALRALEVK